MTEDKQPDLTSQFRELGENLKSVLKAAWESDEAQQFKNELKDGLAELGNAASQAIEDFKVSEAGDRIRAEAEDFKSRVESGEVETKARDELSKVLDRINSELKKSHSQFTDSQTEEEE